MPHYTTMYSGNYRGTLRCSPVVFPCRPQYTTESRQDMLIVVMAKYAVFLINNLLSSCFFISASKRTVSKVQNYGLHNYFLFDDTLLRKLLSLYCRIGIYRATKNSRKASFSRVLYFASERVLQRHLLNQTVIRKCESITIFMRS